MQGYKSRNSHIITQMPLPHTVIDLWRVVHEHNVGSIVMLNQISPADDVRRSGGLLCCGVLSRPRSETCHWKIFVLR